MIELGFALARSSSRVTWNVRGVVASAVPQLDADRLAVEREVHRYSVAPRTRARSAIRMTTPLNASVQ